MSNVGTNLELLGTQFTFDPNRGETLMQIYEGSSEACVAKGMEIRETRPDLSFVIEPGDLPLWRISIRAPDFRDDPASAEVITTYELLGNDLQKDIYEAPFLAGAPADQINIVKAYQADKNSPEPVFGENITSDAVWTLHQLILNGTTAFQTSQYVFRVTSLISARSDQRVSYANVGLVHTSAQVAAGVPQTILFPLVGDNGVPMPAVRDATYFHAGWLKKTPTLSQVSFNKFSLVQEFWLESWAKQLYPAAP